MKKQKKTRQQYVQSNGKAPIEPLMAIIET